MGVSKDIDQFAQIKQDIEEFADCFINKYTVKLPSRDKIIHDTLWGTGLFKPHEIAILDLPLLQRLRQIKQTSLVYQVFPTCTHTRFEHTLGVVFQTQKLIDALHNKGFTFGDDVRNDLRMAAILHDCGQGLFSHLSEEIYRYCDDMQFLTESEEGPFPQRTPHEIFSYLIVKSESMKKYFGKLKRAQIKDQFSLDRIAGWILGIPENNDNELRFRAEIVNGPFDADKLDYIFRDGYFSGLPLGLDLDRLWASCEASIEDTTSAKILTLSQNSATPLEQIIFNKINLFSVVYHHPKVRAGECMLKGLIEYVKENRESIAGKSLDKATDFLWLTDDVLFSEALKRNEKDPLHKMIHDIVYRRLFVRALTICTDTVEGMEEEKGNPDYWALRELNEKTKECHEELRSVAEEIWRAAGKPHTKHHIWLDLPHDPPTSEADRVYVRYPVKEPPGYSLRKLSELFPLNYWVLLYTQHKWRGHVFCPRDCQQKVYRAAKKVLGDKYHLRFKKSAGEISHVPNP